MIFKNIYPEIENIEISYVKYHDINDTLDCDKILLLQNSPDIRRDIRKNNLVDQHTYDKYYVNLQNPIFTTLDFIGHNVINCPLGFIAPCNIQQDDDYYKSYSRNNAYYGRIFWRGSSTHSIRNKIIDYFKFNSFNSNGINIDIDFWNLDPQYSVYGTKKEKPPASEYINYFNQIKTSDLFLIIRGDKPWTNSFFDCLRANTIPVCIDTFYGKIGWENIDLRVEDLFLDINTQSMTMEEIYEAIINLAKNKEKILHMKNNLHIFYNKYILSDRLLQNYGLQLPYSVLSGWGDFYCAKFLEIYNNKYIIINNSFISPLIKNIKQC